MCWHGKSTHLSVDTFIGTGNAMRMMPGVSDLPCPSHFGGVLGVGVARHRRKCNAVVPSILDLFMASLNSPELSESRKFWDQMF